MGQDVVGQNFVGQDVSGSIFLGQNIVGQEVSGAGRRWGKISEADGHGAEGSGAGSGSPLQCSTHDEHTEYQCSP